MTGISSYGAHNATDAGQFWIACAQLTILLSAPRPLSYRSTPRELRESHRRRFWRPGPKSPKCETPAGGFARAFLKGSGVQAARRRRPASVSPPSLLPSGPPETCGYVLSLATGSASGAGPCLVVPSHVPAVPGAPIAVGSTPTALPRAVALAAEPTRSGTAWPALRSLRVSRSCAPYSGARLLFARSVCSLLLCRGSPPPQRPARRSVFGMCVGVHCAVLWVIS